MKNYEVAVGNQGVRLKKVFIRVDKGGEGKRAEKDKGAVKAKARKAEIGQGDKCEKCEKCRE